MNAPNFIIAGAPKCGSTTLFRYLNPHPDVFFPRIKEPGFMIKEYYQGLSQDSPNYQRQLEYLVLNAESYSTLYDDINCKILGDSSISYLFQYEKAIANILRYSGSDTKILFILREPIGRLKSQYQYIAELGFEKLDIKDALEAEAYRLSKNWSSIYAYQKQGLYAEGIKAFKKAFVNVHVMFFEELIAEPDVQMNKVYHFLDIPSNDLGEGSTFNKSGIPRNRAIHNFLMTKNPVRTAFAKVMRSFISEEHLLLFRDKLRGMNQKRNSGIEISNDLKQTLKDFYKEDQKELERLLGRTLPWTA